MEFDIKQLQPAPDYPVYPPYHEGDYLEEYFYNYYIQHKEQFDQTGYTLIPVFWTNVYLTNKNRDLLQPYLDNLDNSKKYFTTSQHDDAIVEKLPVNTVQFTAGGRAGGIPIPLICSPIPRSYISNTVTKDIECSFVGTISTTSGLRQRLYQTLQHNPGFYFSTPRWWTPEVPQDKFNEFINITQRSWFTLCPRGYGLQSFRFFEVLQLGSIPIFVYDIEWFPFKEFIDWSTFSICIHEKDIQNIPNIINNISKEKRMEMLKTGYKVYKEYFTLEQTSKNILKTLQKICP